MGKSKFDVRDVADKIDELIMNPANMQYWRKQLRKGLETYTTDKDLKAAIIDTDPDKNIAAFYTILALCHDDMLRVNPIINDDLKAINTQLCSYPHNCAYMTGGFEGALVPCLRVVVRDLDKNEDSNRVKVVDRSKTNRKELSKPAKNAKALYDYIIEKIPLLADAIDDEIYKRLEIIDLPEKLSEYKLPTRGTWKRNLREARRYYGISKNTRRAGRSSKMHTPKEIQSLREITSQVVDERQETD